MPWMKTTVFARTAAGLLAGVNAHAAREFKGKALPSPCDSGERAQGEGQGVKVSGFLGGSAEATSNHLTKP